MPRGMFHFMLLFGGSDCALCRAHSSIRTGSCPGYEKLRPYAAYLQVATYVAQRTV